MGLGGIAIDWVHNLLFWTDGVLARIEVADLHASTRRVIVWQDLDKPRAIVVHPALGWVVFLVRFMQNKLYFTLLGSDNVMRVF